jgi:hypothetical protein
MFLFARPYYLVDDMMNHYKLIHKKVDQEIHHQKAHQMVYKDQVNRIRKVAQMKLRELLTKPFYTSSIDEEEMEDLCLYAMVLVQQAIGRMQRGDTDAHLVIVDSKMHYHSLDFKDRMRRQGKETSMINVWKSVLDKHAKNEVMQDCFGSLKKALDELELKEDEHNEYEYDDGFDYN